MKFDIEVVVDTQHIDESYSVPDLSDVIDYLRSCIKYCDTGANWEVTEVNVAKIYND